MRRSHASFRTVLIGSFTALVIASTPGAATAVPQWPAQQPLRDIDPAAMAGHGGGTSWQLLSVVALVALTAVAMVAVVMAAAGIRGQRGR